MTSSPGACRSDGQRRFDRRRLLELGAHRNGMGPIYRHPHAGHAGPKGGMVHDLAALVLHFHLLFRVARGQKRIDLRQHVERDLVRIHLAGHAARL